MKLSTNFTLAEFTKSQTAIRKGIDNTPKGEHLINAQSLAINVLQKVRDHFGVTVINSGYRSKELNDEIGGSRTSQHMKGEAVDIEVPGVSNPELAEWILDNLDFDQLILEFYDPKVAGSGWVHVSFKANRQNRKSVLTAIKTANKKTVYVNGLEY